jgi:manganese/zinc/iron transport system permease protein
MLSIALITSITCALPGIFLVLRGVALMSDAISHAILLGIVIMFMLVQSLNSPLLIIGAALAGIVTVVATELLIATDQLKKDAAISLIFPVMFSIAVILINTYLCNIHIDIDMVLLGELAYAPFYRLIVNGIDCGPWALWTMSVLLVINILFIYLNYKELMITIFDNTYAQVSGFKPRVWYYGLMILVSLTCVGAFDVMGSIVVVALMITPAATALLYVQTVPAMIYNTVLLAIVAAIGGYWFAYSTDVSIAGSITLISGILFIIVLFYAAIFRSQSISSRSARYPLILDTICVWLLHNKNKSTSDTIAQALYLNNAPVQHLLHQGIKDGLLKESDGYFYLTSWGNKYAQRIQKS